MQPRTDLGPHRCSKILGHLISNYKSPLIQKAIYSRTGGSGTEKGKGSCVLPS